MKKRFTVKKFKLCGRNSMIAGNPIVNRFPVFGIYDRDWQIDSNCGVDFRGYEWYHHGNYVRYSPELRTVFTDKALAQNVCAKMNDLYEKQSCPKKVGFRLVDHKYEPLWTAHWINQLEVSSFEN